MGCISGPKVVFYGINIESNSFENCSGYFLIDLGFTPYRSYQHLCICKCYNYEGYYHIVAHMDDVIIYAKNPSIKVSSNDPQIGRADR